MKPWNVAVPCSSQTSDDPIVSRWPLTVEQPDRSVDILQQWLENVWDRRFGVREYLENKLLLISINFTPKTSHSWLKKWKNGTLGFPGRIYSREIPVGVNIPMGIKTLVLRFFGLLLIIVFASCFQNYICVDSNVVWKNTDHSWRYDSLGYLHIIQMASGTPTVFEETSWPWSTISSISCQWIGNHLGPQSPQDFIVWLIQSCTCSREFVVFFAECWT